jgi:hypothetical protein
MVTIGEGSMAILAGILDVIYKFLDVISLFLPSFKQNFLLII